MEQALARTGTNWTETLAALWRRRPLACAAALLLAASLVLRSAWFGDPLAGYDEQLYLLVGDRMLDGALPYVDLWDRKPIGLFLIYAGIRLFGGDGVLQYQLLASVFAAATAFVILLILRRHFTTLTALACAMLYLLWIGTIGGEAGQSPVFYNLAMASAALLLFEALPRLDTRAGLLRASGAMLLCGISIAIKTTAVFESAFFGLALLTGCGYARYSPFRFAAAALWFMLLGMLPFGAAAGYYWAIGHFDAFWFANAQSALLRTGDPNGDTVWQATRTLMGLAPAVFLLVASRAKTLDAPLLPQWEARFLTGWIVAAAVGFVSVGYFLQHYALPLMVPLTIAGARFVQGSHRRMLAIALFAAYPLGHQLILSRVVLRDDRAEVSAMVAAISPEVRDRCLFVFGGPPILYHLTRACLVTPYAFSDHLYRGDEAHAIGAEAAQATAAALAARPAVIVTDRGAFPRNANRASIALVRRALARDYRLRATLPYSYFGHGHRAQIWELRTRGLGNSQALAANP